MKELDENEEPKELKCPKCGSGAYGRVHYSPSHYLIYCPNCMLSYGEMDVN